jgi:hypothetical protein
VVEDTVEAVTHHPLMQPAYLTQKLRPPERCRSQKKRPSQLAAGGDFGVQAARKIAATRPSLAANNLAANNS